MLNPSSYICGMKKAHSSRNRKRPERFRWIDEEWDIPLQIAMLRKKAGLSQKDLAGILNSSQQQISRLESPSYKGHSLNTLRRIAEALDAELKVSLQPTPRRKRR